MIVITCNVRASTMANDKGPASWKERRDLCLNIIAGRTPDIICLQECSAEQFRDFRGFFSRDFHVFWINPYPDFDAPENAVFYRKDKFTAVSQGGYHLSPTPHVASASCFGDRCNRVANYVVLENTEGRRFRLVNTHLSVSQESAAPQAEMLLQDASCWPENISQILTGDLNCDFKSPVMKRMLSFFRDSYAEATGIADERFTYHGFLGESYKDSPDFSFPGKIDWILLKGDIICRKSEIVMDHQGELYPSDHYFVTAELTLK